MPADDTLERLGYSGPWPALCEPHLAEGLVPGRVTRTDRGSVLAATADGPWRAKPSTRLVKTASGPADLPAVGDWVAVLARPDMDVALIEAVLPRASAIARGDPGGSSEVQVLAANVDVIFVVHPIAGEPNLRRIERELSLAWDSGAVPVVVLTKADLSEDVAAATAAVESVALGVDVIAVNALSTEGLSPLQKIVAPDRTAVLIGPSGAGKSTIINGLLGEDRQATREVRLGDGRGRHTTVARELVTLPGGGVLIDTPGLRAVGLTGSEEGIASAFADIDELARSCRFRDCSHTGEPGCAVETAMKAGLLSAERLASYRKLMREADVAAARTDARLRAERDRQAKIQSKVIKNYYKQTGRG